MSEGLIDDILDPAQLKQLGAGYSEEDVVAYLNSAVPVLWSPAAKYLEEMTALFYGADLPDDCMSGPTRRRLSPQDKERVLVALQSSRDERYPLAIHLQARGRTCHPNSPSRDGSLRRGG